METMVWAYVFAWAAVITYLTWLGVQNGRLHRRLHELERRPVPSMDERQPLSRAA
jgi:hypothetical protein